MESDTRLEVVKCHWVLLILSGQTPFVTFEILSERMDVHKCVGRHTYLAKPLGPASRSVLEQRLETHHQSGIVDTYSARRSHHPRDV